MPLAHVTSVHPFDNPMRPVLMSSHFTDERVEAPRGQAPALSLRDRLRWAGCGVNSSALSSGPGCSFLGEDPEVTVLLKGPSGRDTWRGRGTVRPGSGEDQMRSPLLILHVGLRGPERGDQRLASCPGLLGE